MALKDDFRTENFSRGLVFKRTGHEDNLRTPKKITSAYK